MSEDLMQYNKTAALIGVGPTGALKPENFEGLWRMSQIFSASGFMPKGMERVESIFVAVQLGMEVGLSPMAAVQNIACINGRPTIWGDAMLGLCRGSGQLERIKEDMIGDGDHLEAICTVYRKGEEDPSIGRFSVADAKRAGMWGKAGPWTQYPRRMLQMRARAFALRDKFPDVLRGLYAREEIDPEFRGAAERKDSAAVLGRIKAPARPSKAPADPGPTASMAETSGPTVADLMGWLTDAQDADELAMAMDAARSAGLSGEDMHRAAELYDRRALEMDGGEHGN
jgi:hypothetical protein